MRCALCSMTIDMRNVTLWLGPRVTDPNNLGYAAPVMYQATSHTGP